ncbi:MAG TPA: DoxX family protein [Gemmatimonadaceae bacterium]|jgi:hypothetical protein|nr:DoxX family protein [Gemmatimonadaceae bacterium]
MPLTHDRPRTIDTFTSPSARTSRASKAQQWTGSVLSALAILFMLFDSISKLMMATPSVQGTAQLGFSTSAVFWIGLALLICTVVYAIPRSAVLGAILLTGYLGGAVASQVRVGNPWLLYTLFPVYVAALVWGGLFLREPRLRALLPLRR